MSAEKKPLIIPLMLFAFLWLFMIAFVSNLVPLRASYLRLDAEHRELGQRIDQGEPDAVSKAGESLSDIFEYKSSAMHDYLFSLEAFVIFGALPTIVVLLGVIWLATASPRNRPAKAGQFAEKNP